ncbi:exopolysaccharide biosynthesis protein, partial [Limosilactobacillus reuteri]
PPNPAELLNSQRMRTLLDTVKSIYDMVIVDVPPMLEVTDTQILSRYLDAVVLVVKQGQTQKLAVKRTVELLKL